MNKMAIKTKRTIRDVIWGDIELTEDEMKIVDSEPFQRLRGIKQLGMAYLVYPCATHTRFEHSLGTLAAAKLMLDRLKKNLEDKDLFKAKLEKLFEGEIFSVIDVDEIETAKAKLEELLNIELSQWLIWYEFINDD